MDQEYPFQQSKGETQEYNGKQKHTAFISPFFFFFAGGSGLPLIFRELNSWNT